MLDAGGDFADGVIAYDGSWLGGETFVSFDKELRGSWRLKADLFVCWDRRGLFPAAAIASHDPGSWIKSVTAQPMMACHAGAKARAAAASAAACRGSST